MPKIPPPPPSRGRRVVVPPPPPVKMAPAVPIVAQPDVLDGTTAHKRRVTLNLIRHAGCCPEELRAPLQRLADNAWAFEAMAREDTELLYGLVDDDMAAAAAAEFQADTRSIRDHRGGTTCALCGQQHIRWEFTIRNIRGGSDVNCGSSCIVQYGLNIDGDGTGEEALKRLRGAINRMKRKAIRHDWRLTHPNHSAIETAYMWVYDNQRPRARILYRHLRPNWVGRSRRLIKAMRAGVRYYQRHGYLTPKRTADWFGPDGYLAVARQMRAERNAAMAAALGGTPPAHSTPPSTPSTPTLTTADSDESDLPF